MMIILTLSSAFIICVLVYIAFILGNNNTVKLTEKSISLSDVMPIHSIEDDFIVNGNGDITVGYKLFLPEVFSLNEDITDDIHVSFENLLKMLPAGTVFHQQNFVYASQYKTDKYSDNFLFQSNLRNLKGKDIIVSYTHIYITFTDGNKKKKDALSTSLLKKAAMPFKKPFDIDKRLKDIKTVLLNVESNFDSISLFSVSRLNSIELNNYLYDYLNLSYNNPTNNAKDEIVDPIALTDSGDLKVGDKIISVVSLVEEGASLYSRDTPKGANTQSISGINLPNTSRLKCGMTYPLIYGLPFDHIQNTIIEVTDPEDTITALHSEKTSMNLIANFYQPASDKQAEIEVFCKQIGEYNLQTSYTAVNIIIHDTDKNRLASKTAFAKQNFSNMNQSVSYIENEETANLFFASMPGNARANYRGFVNTTKQAICYLNKEGLYLSPKTGYIFSDRFGNPINLELWNNELIDNRNRIMIGPSGSGKSFWINGFILQSIVRGQDVIIVDIGGSYKNLIGLNNGRYFDSRKKQEFCFNPFLCPTDKWGRYIYYDTDDGDEEGKEDLVKTIATIIGFIWKENKEISPIENSLIKKSIIAFYEYVNNMKIFPNMKNYRAFLPEFFESLETYQKSIFQIEEIKELLEPYTDGELEYLLNGNEEIDITNDRLIAYDMENVKGKDHFPIVAILTLSVIIDKIKKRRGVPKTLIIDEALDFLIDPKFGDFIGYLFRTFRKKEGEVIIAAQNVQFIMNAAPLVRESILANADTKIILEHGEKYRKQVKDLEILNITQEEQEQILSLQRSPEWREFGIKMGDSFFIFRNGASAQCAAAFDSRQSTVTEIEGLYKEKGSIPAAINAYVNKYKEKMITTNDTNE